MAELECCIRGAILSDSKTASAASPGTTVISASMIDSCAHSVQSSKQPINRFAVDISKENSNDGEFSAINIHADIALATT
jgi:hypothetical protein